MRSITTHRIPVSCLCVRAADFGRYLAGTCSDHRFSAEPFSNPLDADYPAAHTAARVALQTSRIATSRATAGEELSCH